MPPLPIKMGGHGARTAAGALAALGAASIAALNTVVAALGGKAANGANSDITSLSGLTTPLSQAQGGLGNGTGDASGLSVLATGGTTARSNAARASDVVNVLDFDADPTGASDSAGAFKAAILTRASGSAVRLVVPYGTYNLASNVTDNGRKVTIDLMSGALVGANYGGSGSGVLYVGRVESRQKDAQQISMQGQGSATSVATIGTYESVANNGGNAALGKYYNYTNYNTSSANGNGGDIAYQLVANWPSLSGTTAFANWWIAVGPLFSQADQAANKNFSLVTCEVNPVNNAPDTGWTEFDSTKTDAGKGVPSMNTIAWQMVPDIWAPTGGYGGNVNIGLGFFQSNVKNNRPTSSANPRVPTASAPYNPRFYSCVHIGNDATAPGGRGMYLGGNSSGVAADMPTTAIEARYNWPTLITTTSAIFGSGLIVTAAPGQGYGWSTSAGTAVISATNAGTIALIPAGNGAITAYTPGGSRPTPGSNAVDLQVNGSGTAQGATGPNSFTAGNNNSASGSFSFATGSYNVADNTFARAYGGFANTWHRFGTDAFACGQISQIGDAQTTRVVLRANITTASTATRLTADGSSPAAFNTLNIPTNATWHTLIYVQCRDVANGDYAVFKLKEGVLDRTPARGTTYAGDATTAVAPDYSIGSGSNVTLKISADTTNNGLSLQVTTPNSDAWHCSAVVFSHEVI